MPRIHWAALPRLVPIDKVQPPTARLIRELNGFGEESDPSLVASMYRHLSHWPPYLALIRTLLVPLHESGELKSVVAEARMLGQMYGRELLAAFRRPPRPKKSSTSWRLFNGSCAILSPA